MKFFKYFIYISIFFYCGCSDAYQQEKINEFSCPYILPAEKDFPPSWITVKKIPSGRFQLEQIDIAFGNASDLKSRLFTKDRNFDVEITDDWTYLKDRSEYKAAYSEDHDEISMMCTYGKTRAESHDVNLNVELLIPLPQKKPIDCLLIRRDIDPKYEMSCKIK